MKIPFSPSFKIIPIIFWLSFLTKTCAQNPKCPFTFVYTLGDGASDLGNAVALGPFGSNLPATRFPYGMTYPGEPNGRWSDGLNDADYSGRGIGLPNITYYLSSYLLTGRYDGVVLAVAGSTILGNEFFSSRGIRVTLTNIPLARQVNWFLDYINSNICTNQRECSNRRPGNSIFALKHVLANDMRFPLLQGRSILEVATYVPRMVQAQVDAARDLIRQGAGWIVYATSAPLGCMPDILTTLSSNDSTVYDEIGCLKAVNNLVMSYNTALQTTFNALKISYPNVTILGADFYSAARAYIVEKSVRGPNGNNLALRSCCGIGGRYNFDNQRLCGSPNVPVCPNPDQYVYWDGIHFTQEAYRRIVNKLLQAALPLLGCTST